MVAAMPLGMLLAHALALAHAEPDAKSGTVLVQLAEDDSPAAHELAALVERHGHLASPKIRVATPAPGRSRLAAAREACEGGVLGVFWLDARRAEEWRLYALPCATMKPLVREILVTTGAEQASIEATWLITRSSAAAIDTPESVAMTEADAKAIDAAEPEAPEPQPKPQPKPQPTPRVDPPRAPEPDRLGLQLSLGYAGEALARTVPWRHGVWSGIAWNATRRVRVGGWYEGSLPARLEDPDGFAVWRHAVALTVAGDVAIGRRLAIELRGGPELELVRWRSTDLGRSRLRPVPRIGGDATLQIALVPDRLWLDLGLGVAIALIDVDYVTCAAGAEASCAGATRRVTADSWRVRPRARAGLSVQF
jgi:hypothetical protein